MLKMLAVLGETAPTSLGTVRAAPVNHLLWLGPPPKPTTT
jgi:hypothetical protein